jgi:ATP-dependent Clp protease ATP-binding subunit ClpC
VLDDGRLTDGQGKTVDFKNTVIIMTSNVGIRVLQDFGTGIGFTTRSVEQQQKEAANDVLRKEVNRKFPPEFINRIDDIITFNSLNKEHIRVIIDIELADLSSRVAENGYSFELTDEAKDFLIDKGYDSNFGARPLKRAIQTHLEDVIAEAYIDSKVKSGDHLVITKSELGDTLTVQK